MVRLTLRIRSYALSDKPSRVIARSNIFSNSRSIRQKRWICRGVQRHSRVESFQKLQGYSFPYCDKGFTCFSGTKFVGIARTKKRRLNLNRKRIPPNRECTGVMFGPDE